MNSLKYKRLFLDLSKVPYITVIDRWMSESTKNARTKNIITHNMKRNVQMTNIFNF